MTGLYDKCELKLTTSFSVNASAGYLVVSLVPLYNLRSALGVDDERHIRELLVMTLGRMGIRVDSAGDYIFGVAV